MTEKSVLDPGDTIYNLMSFANEEKKRNDNIIDRGITPMDV